MALVKGVICLIALLVGCSAFPKPRVEDDMSMFFEHVDPQARIVCGTQATTGAYPHMAALINGLMVRSYLCGGSILTPRTILTAAHCIEAVFISGQLSNTLQATVGSNFWHQGGVTYSISGNATHPHYVDTTFKNDIGIVYTSSNIAYTNLIRPITVSYDWIGANVASRVAGWGRMGANAAISTALLEVNLNTMDGEQCVHDTAHGAAAINMYAPAVEPHIELCTFVGTDRGVCNGDSGSPLLRISDGQQIGVVSWGFCGRGVPDIFARASAYRDWVIANTI